MAKVTAIVRQSKQRSRVSVFLDGEFAFGLHQDVLLDAGIAQGDQLDERQIRAVLALEEVRRAKEKALRLLAVRARSKAELDLRLSQASLSPEAIAKVMADLERLGLVNDAEFAASFARHRQATKPVGERRLRQELRRKGVAEGDVEYALAQAFSEVSEVEYARRLASKRKHALDETEEERAKKRVTDYLLRRGFPWDAVSDLLTQWQEL